MIKVSVIIPVYNVEKYIERCASSLFEQTLSEIEYIFVDDGSIDRSLDILYSVVDRYGVKSKVEILHHSKNRGVSAARNTGLLCAVGEYIGWVDADDWIEKDMYSLLYLYAFTHGCDCVYCGFIKENRSSLESHYSKCNESRNALENIKNLLTGMADLYLWDKLIKRSLFVENHISFPEKCDMWEDFAVLISLVYYAEYVGCVNHLLYHYRERDDSVSLVCSKKQIDSMIKNITSIELFLRNIGASEDLLLYIAKNKFFIKNAYLSLSGDVNGWYYLFPEVNRTVWKQNVRWYIKLYEWGLTKHIYWIYRLYQFYRKQRRTSRK